jgi:hypothetical protein
MKNVDFSANIYHITLHFIPENSIIHNLYCPSIVQPGDSVTIDGLWIVNRIYWTLCDCEAVAHARFRHLCQFFMEPSDYYDAPIYKVPHFIRGVGLIKG